MENLTHYGAIPEPGRTAGGSSYENLPETGLMRTQTNYSQAVQVIKPRNLEQVIQKCLTEAAIAGDDFYYSWKQGGKVVEGITVGAALAIARNFGNCAIDTDVNETPESYIFYAAFVDLETGFNLRRAFRQNKSAPKKKDGTKIYDDERGEDILFQIGQSKAIRNVVKNAMPNYIQTKILAKAKEMVMENIKKLGKVKAQELVLKKLSNLQIDQKRVESIYGPVKSWDEVKLVQISGNITSIENGYDTVDNIFPLSENEGALKPEIHKAEIIPAPVVAEAVVQAREVQEPEAVEVPGFPEAERFDLDLLRQPGGLSRENIKGAILDLSTADEVKKFKAEFGKKILSPNNFQLDDIQDFQDMLTTKEQMLLR